MTCCGQKRVDAQSQPARAIRPAMLGAPAASDPARSAAAADCTSAETPTSSHDDESRHNVA